MKIPALLVGLLIIGANAHAAEWTDSAAVSGAFKAAGVTEKADAYSLYAKTGWSDSSKPGIGWWTGWVQKGERTDAFALNIDIANDADGQQRVPLGRASLAALGILAAPGSAK